jgi:hypothetical protein
MIVVKIELHSAITGAVTELGKMVISNDDTHHGDPTRGDYTVRLGRRGNTETINVMQKPQKTGKVLNYPRLSYSVWVLVARALKAVGIEKWSEFKE